jgi:putative phosphoribosyl transferase
MPRVRVGRRVSWPTVAFGDRHEAGIALVQFVEPEVQRDSLVLALPRGGIPVGQPLAEALRAPLEPALVRKLPIPSSPEMGFGAVTIDGSLVLNESVVAAFGIRGSQIQSIADKVRREVRRRAARYVGNELALDVRGKRVYMVDDGLATGYSMMAAAKMVRGGEPSLITLCVPVSPADSLSAVQSFFDEIYCLILQDRPPFAVASFYRDFHDLSDQEVVDILRSSKVPGSR